MVVVAVEGLENRIGFNGIVAADRETYVGRDVAHLFRPGSANPVRYLPLDALLTDPSIPPASVAPTAALESGMVTAFSEGAGSALLAARTCFRRGRIGHDHPGARSTTTDHQ